MTNHDINIRHGFVLPFETNLFELVRTLEGILAPVQRQLQIQDIALHAARILDTADLQHRPRPESVIFDAFQAHNDHVGQVLSGEHHCPLTNMTATVLEGGDKEGMYLVADAQHDVQVDALVESGIGEYTPYWDEGAKGRRPAGVTTAQWDARGAAWAKATVPVEGHPTATAITLPIGEPFADIDLVSDAQAVLDAMPPLETRVTLVLNGLGAEQAMTPEDMADFVKSMPARIDHVTRHLQPITLDDLSGVRQT